MFLCAIFPTAAVRKSLAGRVPCGIPATLSRVMSEDLVAVAKRRGVPGLGQQVHQIVPASKILSRYIESSTLVNPGISILRVYKDVGHIFRH